MKAMIRIAAILLALTLSVPSVARAEDENNNGDAIRRGLELLFEELQEGMEDFAQNAGPALRQFLEEMGPALSDMIDQVEDWSRYEPPEMLPNGDIIIRRKPDPEPELPPDHDQNEEDSGPVDI